MCAVRQHGVADLLELRVRLQPGAVRPEAVGADRQHGRSLVGECRREFGEGV
jgi:hypothetical protein